jgi:hypothetical protein
MSREGSGQAGSALITVARFRLGRILLWIVASPFLLVGGLGLLANERASDNGRLALGVFCIGAAIALFPIIGAWKARRARRPSPIKWFLIRLALAGIVLGGAMLLTWLLNRRSKAAPALPPPRPEEVDQLCGSQDLAA